MSSFGTVFGHPPPCCSFLVDSVSHLSSGLSGCDLPWPEGEKKCRQRLETCFWIDYTCLCVLLSSSWHTPALAHLLVHRERRDVWSYLSPANTAECNLEQVPSLLCMRDWFCGRQFSERGGRWFQDDSSTLFNWALYFCYYYIRSSGIRSQRLGTPGLVHASITTNIAHLLVCSFGIAGWPTNLCIRNKYLLLSLSVVWDVLLFWY